METHVHVELLFVEIRHRNNLRSRCNTTKDVPLVIGSKNALVLANLM